VTEGEAAPAAVAEPGSRNLLIRVVAALVLAPLAIAIAYAGGWLWTGLVTLAAIGLYVEWLTIVDAARQMRVVASGGAALVISGFCLAAGRIDASLSYWLSPVRRCVALAGAARLDCGGIRLCGGGRDGIGAGAPRSVAGICSFDPDPAGGVGDRYRRLFRRPRHRRPKTLAAGKPRKTWAGAVGGFAASLVIALDLRRSGLAKPARCCCWAGCSRSFPVRRSV